MKLEIDRLIKSRNQLDHMHWSKRHRETKDWERLIKYTCLAEPLKTKQKIFARITSNRKRLLDQDNLVGGCKPVLDALKRLGLIVDDSPKWLEIKVNQKTGGDVNTVILLKTEGEL